MGMVGRVISLCLGAGLFLNCALDEPKAPSWEVDLQFPLTQQNISVKELLADNSAVFSYEDGLIGFRAEGEFDTSRVGDNLRISDIDERIKVDIPNLTIPRLNADDVSFSLRTLAPSLADLHGQTAVVPSFQFSDAVGFLVPETDVVSIRLKQGVARLIYENNLPVDLENVVFTLVEPSNGEIKIVSPKIDRIAAGVRDSLDIDISGKELTHDGKWYVRGDSPGSRGKSVLVDADASVSLLVDFVDFRVTSVTGRGQAFFVQHDDSVQLAKDIKIHEATFREGMLEFDLYNGLPLDLDVIIRSKHIRNVVTNKILELNISLRHKGRHREVVDLRDYKIDFGDLLPQDQYLAIFFEANGKSGDDEIVTVSEYDSISIGLRLTNALLDRFRGTLDHFAAPIPSFEQRVSMPQNLDRFNGLNLADAQLLINFYNTIAMPIDLRGKFIGLADGNKSATLDIDVAIQPGEGAEVKTPLVFNSDENSQIRDLVNLMPQRVQFSGTAFIGDGQTEGEINGEHYVRGQYVLETPAKLSWKETVLEADTTFLQIDPEGLKTTDLRRHVIHLDAGKTNVLREFVINAEIENHLPIGATIEYRIRNALSRAAETAIIAPVEINSAAIDVAGKADKSFNEKARIRITGEDITIFHNDSDSPKLLSLVTRIRLHGSNGETVKVYESDYLAINALAKLVVGVNME